MILFIKKIRYLIYFSIIYLIFCIIFCKIDLLFTLIYPHKIWIHRVNSIEKLHEVKSKKFNRFELDIVFIEKTVSFDVNHPPVKSINLSLDNYLSSISPSKENKFWLDFKNLSETNKHKSLSKLKSICTKNKLKKSQLIIESTKPEHLTLFIENGFTTSYYLPWQLYKKSKKEISKEIKGIKKTVQKNITHYISFDMKDYHIVYKNFPDKKIITWLCIYNAPIDTNPINLYYRIKSTLEKIKIFSNPNVEIVLFKYVSKKGDR